MWTSSVDAPSARFAALLDLAPTDFLGESGVRRLDVQKRTSMEIRRYVFRTEFVAALASYWQKVKDVAGFPGAMGANLREIHD